MVDLWLDMCETPCIWCEFQQKYKFLHDSDMFNLLSPADVTVRVISDFFFRPTP